MVLLPCFIVVLFPVYRASAKVAIIETGASITVPLFVEEGNVIRVNTEDKEYLDRIVN